MQKRSVRRVVSVSGDVLAVEMNAVPGGSGRVVDVLRPTFMSPPPPLITLSERVPEIARKEINLAFQLFWMDNRICASRLRTSLERLMDHFGVARFRKQPGKRRPLDLAARIDKLPKKVKTQDLSAILHALRTIGNLGTHGSKVTRAAMLDAFQLYEMALAELFKDESETAKAIIKRLKSQKH
jgi:hypothetical protein